RRVDLARPAKVNVPAAVRQLAFQNVTGATFLERNVNLAEPMHEQHEVGAEGAVDDQFAAPMAILVLLTQQILLRALNRVRNVGFSGNEGSFTLRSRAP